jgi:uncharacterized protein (TIGR02246 family)
MRYATSLSAGALGIVLLAGGPVSSQDLSAIVAETAANYAKAFNQGAAGEVAALHSEDAVVLAPNAEKTTGRAAVEASVKAYVEQMGARNLEIEPEETVQHGDAVIQTGTYSMTMNSPAGDMPVKGDWLSVLEKSPDGVYRITRHIWNMDVPPAPQ